MITVLAKLFQLESFPEARKRSAYGMLCGIVGIILNILLFAGKFFAGTVSGSIAITTDAFNNLSDAGASVVTLAGFKLAGQKADSDHPFGHGRMEYLAGLIVAAIILIMAVELIRDSVWKIFHPSDTLFSLLIAGILLASIGLKCYMAFYNYSVGKRLASAALCATATDSMSDCVATSVVLLTAGISSCSGLHLDGLGGVIVGLFIFWAGIQAAKDTLNPLLGQAPEKEYVEQIEKIALHFDENISGIHDLMVHDYGPGNRIISLHVEVPEEGDIRKMHDIIDNLEMKLSCELGCTATIHMDPVVTKDEYVAGLRKQVQQILGEMDSRLSLHDFRVVAGETHTNLIFDVVVPFSCKLEDREVVENIEQSVKQEIGENYFVVIKVDKAEVI